MGSDYRYIFKLIIVGDGGAGKTSLLLRFTDNTFTENHTSTIGVDFKIKTLETAQDGNVCLQLWDTSGQERFNTLVAFFYRATEGLIVVYDVTDANSFRHVRRWFKEAEYYGGKDRICSRLLIGSKCDLKANRAVSREAAEALAKELGVAYIETSAKDTTNVSEAFVSMADAILQVKRGHQHRLTDYANSGTLNIMNRKTPSYSHSYWACCASY